MITDLSNFSMIDKPIMTIIDINNKKHQFFKIIDNKKALEAIKLPYITKREHEIVLQMIKGLNTPQISAALNISYNTVENHKRNLRTKTSTKTSAELIHFVMSNNILWKNKLDFLKYFTSKWNNNSIKKILAKIESL